MEYTPVSSFRRPITAVQLKRAAQADGPLADAVSKWDALRKLTIARKHFGLSDRNLTVLQALLSFHPETELGRDNPPAIVFPSNKAICERLNGMPCSTMRRHVASLVDAGVILRRDSPNGKRYARRGAGTKIAFGFDLTPLATRFHEISDIAHRLTVLEARRTRLRDTVSLMRRDLAGFVDFGISMMPDLPQWDQISDLARLTARELRRSLSIQELTTIKARLQAALNEVTACLDAPQSNELSTSDAEIEHHHQNSNIEYMDKNETEISVVEGPIAAEKPDHQPPPLSLVLEVCKEIQTFSQSSVRHWDDLVRLSDTVSPMMGVTTSVWKEAQYTMGKAQAATALAAMLQRFAEIQSPSAYIKSLSQKASQGAFTCGAMIRALQAKSL